MLALGNRSGAPRRMPCGVGADLKLSNREFDWLLSLVPGGSKGLETLGISQALPVIVIGDGALGPHLLVYANKVTQKNQQCDYRVGTSSDDGGWGV